MKRLYWPLVAYIAVLIVVFGRALLPGATQMIWGDDIHRQYYFYRQFFNSFVDEGILPWWNPYLFAGVPFIANAVVNIWYPPTWLFFFLPLNVAYSWHVALHILWAMLGMYCALRAMPNVKCQMSNVGAWVAGLVFGLSGFFSARVFAGHVDIIAAASWMPWVVWAFSRRGVVLAAVVFAMQLLAGYQTMAMMTAIAVGIVTRRRLRAVAAGLLGIGLAGIQIIPLQEFFRQSIRTFAFPYTWNSYGSLTVASLKQFLNPFAFGDQISYFGPPPNYTEHAFFVGRWSLMIIAVSFLIFTPLLWSFAVIAVFGLWVSLGPNAPIDLQYLLWKIAPMYQYLRIPPRHLILVVFGLSALIAHSLSFARPGLAKLTIVVAMLISVEMILYARHFIVLRPIPETRHDAELITLLSPPRCRTSFTSGVVDEGCLFRVLPNFGVWVPPRDSFDFDSAMSYRVFNATGYDPSILRLYYEYIDIANGQKPGASVLDHDVQIPYLNVFSPATDFLNIKYLLVPRQYDPLYGVKNDRFVLLREDSNRDYRLYENKTVKQRFFFEGGGRATIEKYGPNEIVLIVDTAKDETLMSSEVFYPGWEGFVDGKKVDIVRINHAFRALFVPSGRHTVVYRYNPRIFWIGGAISVISLVMCFLIWKKSAVQ